MSVTLTGQDADGDALSYYLASLPAHGSLSYVDPQYEGRDPHRRGRPVRGDRRRRRFPAAWSSTRRRVGYTGPDGASTSWRSTAARFGRGAAWSATVYPADEDPVAGNLIQPVALSVKGADGTTIANYRWTLEEDLTYKVVPGVADRQHRSRSVPHELHAGRGVGRRIADADGRSEPSGTSSPSCRR